MPYSTLKTKVLREHPNKFFIETGTAKGEGVLTAIECGFDEIYTIEANPDVFKKACEKFIDEDSVVLLMGDSGAVLPDILSHGDIDAPATFWLDAHWSEGESDLGPGIDKCPILRDISAIGEHSIKSHTILIDDMRYFRAGGLPVWGNIKLGDIMDQIMEVNPMYRIDFAEGLMANDVLVATVKE